jgi:hypothetical protein
MNESDTAQAIQEAERIAAAVATGEGIRDA